MATRRPIPPLPFLLPGMLSLLAGLAAGVVRLGWASVSGPPTLVMAHGPLMVSGFLGTLIGLERAVALGRGWGYAAPGCAAAGALLLLAGAPPQAAGVFFTSAGVVLLAIFAAVLRTEPQPFTVVMALGGLSWTIGNGLWAAGVPVPQVVSFWFGYLILTIAGERLELSRLVRPGAAAQWTFRAIIAVLLAAIAIGGSAQPIGAPLLGVTLIALAAWLLRHDIARRTVRQHGLSRFTAICMLSGYAWLGIGGLLMLAFGPIAAGFGYDAVLHALFLGFVFAMIFGHAPIIFPAVLRIPIPFRAGFYAQLVLLHASLVVRIGGDVAGNLAWRRWGGVLNAAAIIVFLANTALAAAGRHRPAIGTVPAAA